ncbi:MAG: UDP-N-acetylmuramoyl-L-alanine--D-glutamate ligase [Candidatus Chromulinivorax sp.]
MRNLYQKNIGIWGFGIVGQSALDFFDKQQCNSIQILDKKEINLPTTQTPTISILQSPDTIKEFLDTNDYILTSPGIKLHDYQNFTHKFITELDILTTRNQEMQTIAITGSIGKTSITHILAKIMQHTYPNTIAAGNIGNPMLSLIDNQPSHAVLELSSFQLQYSKKFAPNLAILTNLYPNHLDHHQSIEEYLLAKCNNFKHQTSDQKTLLPLDLIEQINQHIPIQAHWVFFTPNLLSAEQQKQYQNHIIYYLDAKIIYKAIDGTIEKIYDLQNLPELTFDTNWLIIIAACNLWNINLTTILPAIESLSLPDHRLQKIGQKNGSIFYNDSKSTVWQATLQAVNAMDTTKPIFLFLGGLSKGADRTPLLQALEQKNITIFAFGKESKAIANLCKQFNIPCYAHATLDGSWQALLNQLNQPTSILFSPGGSSYDLFKDYQERGEYFNQLVLNYCK